MKRVVRICVLVIAGVPCWTLADEPAKIAKAHVPLPRLACDKAWYARIDRDLVEHFGNSSSWLPEMLTKDEVYELAGCEVICIRDIYDTENDDRPVLVSVADGPHMAEAYYVQRNILVRIDKLKPMLKQRQHSRGVTHRRPF